MTWCLGFQRPKILVYEQPFRYAPALVSESGEPTKWSAEVWSMRDTPRTNASSQTGDSAVQLHKPGALLGRRPGSLLGNETDIRSAKRIVLLRAEDFGL